MLVQRNVTISVPEDILREARHLAVDRGVSLSRFVGLLLEEKIDAARRRKEAGNRQRRLLAKGLEMGTQGKIAWSREDLHERQRS